MLVFSLGRNQRWQLGEQLLSETSYFLLRLKKKKNHDFSFTSLAVSILSIFYTVTNSVILIKLTLFREVIVSESSPKALELY